MKIAAVVLLCLVTLALIYGCSVIVLNYQSKKPISVIEGFNFLKSLMNPSYRLQADPIDSPRPSPKPK